MKRRTPLYEKHVEAGARFVNFGGWELPVRYGSQIDEHHAVRQRAGLFDVSHMGEVEVFGEDAVAAVNRVITNDLSQIEDGTCLYSPMCNTDGGIVDDLVVYRYNEGHVFICVNAANREKDFDWIDGQLADHASVEQRSDAYAQLAVQGPLAAGIVQACTRLDLSGLDRFAFTVGAVAGVDCMISRTGYTGEDGFELYVAPAHAPTVWDALRKVGGEDLVPCGLGARDTLRLEYKMALYGNDIDDTTTPLEAGLSWTVKMGKEDFVGRDAIAKQKAAGIPRRLVGFTMEGRAIARHGYDVIDEAGDVVGQVTSGAPSPTLGKNIGLAYVPQGQHRSGTPIHIRIRGRRETGTIVKTPFIRKD